MYEWMNEGRKLERHNIKIKIYKRRKKERKKECWDKKCLNEWRMGRRKNFKIKMYEWMKERRNKEC